MNALDIKHDIRTALSTKCWALPVFGLRPSNRKLIARRNTEIVIEGFPRCANTFSVVAFQQAQKRPVKVAHHLHLPSQIIFARNNNIPAILLVREPLDAIISLKIRHPELDTKRCIRDYLSFYKAILDIKEYPVVADFEKVTTNFGLIIDQVNERYNSSFQRFSHTEEATEKVFLEIEKIRRAAKRSINQVAVPTAEKNSEKIEVRETIVKSIGVAQLRRADELYKQFLPNNVRPQEN